MLNFIFYYEISELIELYNRIYFYNLPSTFISQGKALLISDFSLAIFICFMYSTSFSNFT